MYADGPKSALSGSRPTKAAAARGSGWANAGTEESNSPGPTNRRIQSRPGRSEVARLTMPSTMKKKRRSVVPASKSNSRGSITAQDIARWKWWKSGSGAPATRSR
jgi:hypothetical protein